ncbi:MAG: LUD domain-containing protein [Actinomycetota bacterium]|nr:LUD domain-containing protein [Actinomycetota bacterium]
MSSREEMLSRLRIALQDVPAGEGLSDVDIRRDYRRTAPADIALFAERVGDYRATVHRVPAEGLAMAVAAALRRRPAARIVVPPGVPHDWLSEVDAEVAADHSPLTNGELDAVDGVVTGCAVAVAETGTIVLDGGSAQGRRAITLVPDYHLCVVLADQVVGSVPEALARLDPTRPLTFISGPSATSDIELDRVEGVHGPRTLEVIVVEPPAG